MGTLEEALGAFGLAHLWPLMREEEMDVETVIMLEYDDLVDLGVEACVSRADAALARSDVHQPRQANLTHPCAPPPRRRTNRWHSS